MATDLIGQVADLFDLTRADLTSASRKRHVVAARQAAAWVLRHAYPQISLQTIGEQLGGRDHSTVIHAVRLIEELRTRDADMDGDVRSLLRQLES